MSWLQKLRTFSNGLRSESPVPSIDRSNPQKNRRRLKILTSADSGKLRVAVVDEEFLRSMTSACFDTKLCPQCEALKLDERIAEALRSPKDLSIWSQFSTLLPTMDESCAFCQFYRQISSGSSAAPNVRCFEVQSVREHHLLVMKSWDLFITKHAKTSGFSDVQVLRGENSLGLRCPEAWPISSVGVDYEELRRKLAFCDGRGAKYILKDTPPPAHPIFVINCHTRKVEPLVPGTKYVCLSYVWGPPKGENPDFGDLPDPTERTVEDAITVTSKLHYQYLWVDKYCIDQKDENMKMAQINQMDCIYAQADLTIIAAAGDHADYGLPGVSTQPRSPRRSFKIGDYVLMSCWEESSLAHGLRQSKWMERGWTYQEALLSQRRLFFTDYCYLHDCGKCYIEGDESKRFESWVNSPTLVNHGRMKSQSKWMGYNISTTLPDACARIEEYSKRNLSYQSDSLNAITGVLQTLELSDPPIHHYYGVPMLQPSEREAEPSTSNMDGFVQSLRWSLNASADKKRRPDFPSWSWVGWQSPCSYLQQNLSVLAPSTVKVEIEQSSGARIDWSGFAEKGYLKQDQPSQSHCIWIEAWTFPVETLDTPPSFHENVQRAWLVRNHDFETSRFKGLIEIFYRNSTEDMKRLKAKCEARKVVAVVLGDISKELPMRSIIIVEELDGVYQRVGNFDDNDFSLLFDIGPSFWERDIVKLSRRWIRLS
ncbi:uncharacterized protein BKCO1_32000106 [Diplodia corticola]|uniref:Heterokaryon incompatibility domain-containing protein n=1 Tax=Diplodia corticola TaxID=236234 RepID=A0A1J9QYV9_9PEZI|nr:uncharacterized protein BKCO1_32000106 [Diplodia corticola]OJD33178.1 hypothetical protein BKCO1_32000106 [Diplodia corticola]